MDEFLNRLCSECEGISSIWLVGSRANGTFRDDSDWDYIVFADQSFLEYLKGREDLHVQNVDFLVVFDGNKFQNAWGLKEKTGSLSSWQWRQTTGERAEYMEAKWEGDDENGDVVCTNKNAIRVWPIGSTL